MTILLQVGLGLLPAAVIIWIVMIRRKAFGWTALLCGTVLMASSVGCLGLGLSGQSATEPQGESLGQDQLIQLANTMFVEGVYDQALETLDEYSEHYGYDDQCRLLSARISYAQGDTARGLGLYTYLAEQTELIQTDSAEYQQALTAALYSPSDLAYVTFLEENGLDPVDSGYDATALSSMKTYMDVDLDDIIDEMVDSIQGTYDVKSGSFSEYAELCGEFTALYESFQEKGRVSSKDVENLLEDLADLVEEDSSLSTTDTYRDMMLKLNVLAEDFEGLVAGIGASSSYHEVMIAAELFLSEMVSPSDFSEAYQVLDRTVTNTVKEQLDVVYDIQKNEFSDEEKEDYEARVEAINTAIAEPTLSTLKSQLVTQAEESSAVADQTKMYLQLAKIEQYFQDDSAADSYINQAIYSSQASEDTDYATAMAQIISVIDNDETGDLEDIKNVSGYVDAVLDHSLTVDVESIVSSGTQVEEVFQQTMVDYVSRAKSAISIGRLDTESFETITAQVQISTDSASTTEALKDAIRVYDCGVEITDFTLTKLEYTQSNFILCCDVSGSMDSAIGDLRSAVVTFVEGREKDEDISVVKFSDSVTGSIPFGSSDGDLITFGENLIAGGGTNMFGALSNCLSGFQSEVTENSVVILMTDGQDGTRRSDEEIYSTIGARAEEAGITVYTVGLGSSVDTDYLSTLADAGGGGFIYVSDSASLESFFTLLHSQADNQYILEYDALDTMVASSRELRVVLEADNVADSKIYGIGTEDGDMDVMNNVTISGLSDRYLYKGNQAVETTLKGSGFTAGATASLKLSGTTNYYIALEYQDSETYRLTLPANLAEGTYNVEVTIQGNRGILVNGFSVLSEEETTIVFGDYTFTGNLRIDDDASGTTTLRGGVTMNGWLHFKGDVVFTGDLEGDSVYLTDNSGSYVRFDSATAVGLGKTLAAKGISQDIPLLGKFTLYRDSDNTDEIRPGVMSIYQLMYIESPSFQLMPYELKLNLTELTPALPYIADLLSGTKDKSGNDETFKTELSDVSASITNKNIGIAFSMGYEDNVKKDQKENTIYNHNLSVMGQSLPFNGSVKLAVDTIKEEYTVGAMVSMDFMGEGGGLSAEVTWANGGIDAFGIDIAMNESAQKALTFYYGAVPISLTEFGIRAENVMEAINTGSLGAVQGTGKITLEAAKISAVAPALKEFVGDVSVLSMPSASVTFRAKNFYLGANAKLVLFKDITIAQAKIELGNFKYTESMLNMNGVDVQGLSAEVSVGVEWKLEDGAAYLKCMATGQLDAHSRFIGLGVNGTAEMGMDWWLIDMGTAVEGDIVMGLYTSTAGEKYWILIVNYMEDHWYGEDTQERVVYYIDENGKAGDSTGVLI